MAQVRQEAGQENIRIQKMSLLDLPSVMVVEKTCFTSPWSIRAFISELLDNSYAHYYVAKKRGKVVGYAGMWIVLDEAHVTNVAVHRDHRGEGIGRLLVLCLIRNAALLGATKMTLEVRRSNVVAQNLYRQFGFVFSGVRKGYYVDDNEDAFIMWLDPIPEEV